SIGIRATRRCPRRSRKHSNGHAAPPTRHRPAKDADLQSLDGAQVRRRRESIRTSSDDRYVACGHKFSNLQRVSVTVAGRRACGFQAVDNTIAFELRAGDPGALLTWALDVPPISAADESPLTAFTPPLVAFSGERYPDLLLG